jgi:hypothetical protein
MEQALSTEGKANEPDETKRLAEDVYEDMLARKEFLEGIYRQEQSLVEDCKIKIAEGSTEREPVARLPEVFVRRGRLKR